VPTIGEVVSLARPDREQSLGGAAAAFLAQPSLAPTTRRSYQQTLDRLERKLGVEYPVEDLTVEGGHRRGEHRVGVVLTGDVEPARGHRPLVRRLLPPAPLAHRRPRR
jgi:hypothetical protein